MGKAYKVNADDVQLNGRVPPFTASSGRLTNAAAAQFGNMRVAPCDLYIERVVYNIDTQFTHASSAITVGSVGTAGAYVNSFNIQNAVVGAYELNMADASVVTRIIPKGTAYAAGLAAADTTGKITIELVLRSRVQGDV